MSGTNGVLGLADNYLLPRCSLKCSLRWSCTDPRIEIDLNSVSLVMAKSSSIPSHSSPSNLGYRLPAEWEKHQATWMTWPEESHFKDSQGDSGKSLLTNARNVFVQIVQALATTENVLINVADDQSEREALKSLGTSHPRLRFCHAATDSFWCRDYSPSYVCRRDAEWRTPPLVAIDWGFVPQPVLTAEGAASASNDGESVSNGALASTQPHNPNDDVFPMFASRTLEIPCISGGMALHGGDIETNGAGMLLTTERCLLGRNPEFKKQWIADRLRAMLGVTEICWLVDLPGANAKSATQRVDCLARFLNEQTVAALSPSSTLDPGEQTLRENLRRLSAKRSGVERNGVERSGVHHSSVGSAIGKDAVENGRPHGPRNGASVQNVDLETESKPLDVVPLPTVPYESRDSSRLGSRSDSSASYTDFYIANEVVLMPAFGLPTDATVRDQLAGYFPTRQILAVDCDLNAGSGWIHRITQHIPALDLARK